MRLNKITKSWLKQFAEPKIYQRGEDYFHSGKVYRIDYDPNILQVKAKVTGNYGHYDVKISEKRGQLVARCDCPYDFYPCKHVIAVLLNFIENKAVLKKKAERRKNERISLKQKLEQLPPTKLVKIIIDATKLHPEFEKDLQVLLKPNDSQTLELFLEQIQDVQVDDMYGESGSDLEKIRAFRKILDMVEKASPEIQVRVNWKIADKILAFLNRYGVSDENWEDLVLQIFDILSSLLSKHSELEGEKQDIFKQLRRYQAEGNCCIVDEISELMNELRF